MADIDVTQEEMETHIHMGQENEDEDAYATNENQIPDTNETEFEPEEVLTEHEKARVFNALHQQLPDNAAFPALRLMRKMQHLSVDERLFEIYGFNPKAYCWQVVAEDGTLSEPANVPTLQVWHHRMNQIDALTRVQMIETETSGPSICPEPMELQQVFVLWHGIKYVRSTWEIMTDNMNVIEKFAEFDQNGDGFIDRNEVIQYWQFRGLDPKQIEGKLKLMSSADKNMDGMINFFEFKRRFFVIPENFFNDDFKIRLSRYGFVIVIPVLCLIILSIAPSTKLSVVMGVSIQLLYMIYFATLGYYFWNGMNISEDEKETSYLFRVFSRPGLPQIKEGKWAPLRMPLNQIAYPLKAIHSVSEFSAVGGAMPSIMLANIGQFTWAMVTLHFMVQTLYNDDFGWNFSDFAVIIGVAGLVMLGVYEADPFNDSVNNFHMLGALTGFGTVIGYIAQQNPFDPNVDSGGLRNALSLLLAVLFIMFYWLWNVTLSYCSMEEARSWGMYNYGAGNFEEKKAEDQEEMNSWRKKHKCCYTCCLLSGLPLIGMLCVGCGPICAAAKHKKAVKKLDESKMKKKYMMEFQPCLPFWKLDITPDMKRRISTMSVANVLFEGVVLMVGSTALSLWLMDYERVCTGFCLDQVVMLVLLLAVLVTAIWGSYHVFGIVSSKKFYGVST